MRDRAARYAPKEYQQEKKRTTGRAVLIAYVARTARGKIRLRKIGIRLEGRNEEMICELPVDDPRYVFESDYKVRKAAHDEVKHSAKFSRFYDSSARVFYET
ncbi:MAG: hypothetical protein ACRDF4_10040 [Rhabdochlamydiaceae bacterium]